MTESERRRLQDAFRRLGGGGSGGTVGKSAFVSDVLGAGFPAGLAERIFGLVGAGDGGGGVVGGVGSMVNGGGGGVNGSGRGQGRIV